MEIALRVITSMLIVLSTSVIAGLLYPKFQKQERENEEKAKTEKSVYADKKILKCFATTLIIVNIIGIFIIALPKIVSIFWI